MTIDSNLLNNAFAGALAKLEQGLAPISKLTTDFSTAAIGKSMTVDVAVIDSGTISGQASISDWESTSLSATCVPVSMYYYSNSFDLSQATSDTTDLTLNDYVAKAASKVGRGITNQVIGLFNASTQTVGNSSVAVSSFDGAALANLYPSFGMDTVALLDVDLYRKVLPQNTMSFTLADGAYGFEAGVYNTGTWSNGKIKGAGVAKNAIACAARMPNVPAGAEKSYLVMENVVLPGIGLPAQYSVWYSTKTRSLWGNITVIFGSAVADLNGIRLHTIP